MSNPVNKQNPNSGVQEIFRELSQAVESESPEDICSTKPVEKFCTIAVSVAATGKMTEQQLGAMQGLAAKIDGKLNIVAQRNAALRLETEHFPEALTQANEYSRQLSEELEAAISSVKELKSIVASQEEQSRRLQNRLTEVKAANSMKEAKLGQLSSSIRSLEEDKEKLKLAEKTVIDCCKSVVEKFSSINKELGELKPAHEEVLLEIWQNNQKITRLELELNDHKDQIGHLKGMLSEKEKEITQTRQVANENVDLKGRVHSLSENMKDRDFLLTLRDERIQSLEALNSKLKQILLVGSAKFEDQNEQGLKIMKILTRNQVYSDMQISDLQKEVQVLEAEIQRLNHLLESSQRSSSSTLALEFQSQALEFQGVQEIANLVEKASSDQEIEKLVCELRDHKDQISHLKGMLSEKEQEITQAKQAANENADLKGRVHSLVDDVEDRNFILKLNEDRIQILEALNSKLKEVLLLGSAKFNEGVFEIMKVGRQNQVYSNLQIADLQMEVQELETEIQRLNHLLESSQQTKDANDRQLLEAQKCRATAASGCKSVLTKLFEVSGKLKQSDQQVFKLQEQLLAAQKVKDISIECRRSTLARLVEVSQALKQSQRVGGALQHELSDQKNLVNGLQKTLERKRIEDFEALKQSQRVGSALQQELSDQKTLVNGLQKTLEAKDAKIARKKEKIRKLKETAAKLPSTIPMRSGQNSVVIPSQELVPFQPILLVGSSVERAGPVRQRSIGRLEAGWNFVTKNPLLTAVTVAGMAATIGVFVASRYSSEEDTSAEGMDFYTTAMNALSDVGSSIASSLREDVSAINGALAEVRPGLYADFSAIQNALAEVKPALQGDVSAIKAAWGEAWEG
jgi:hypothetical protein